MSWCVVSLCSIVLCHTLTGPLTSQNTTTKNIQRYYTPKHQISYLLSSCSSQIIYQRECHSLSERVSQFIRESVAVYGECNSGCASVRTGSLCGLAECGLGRAGRADSSLVTRGCSTARPLQEPHRRLQVRAPTCQTGFLQITRFFNK